MQQFLYLMCGTVFPQGAPTPNPLTKATTITTAHKIRLLFISSPRLPNFPSSGLFTETVKQAMRRHLLVEDVTSGAGVSGEPVKVFFDEVFGEVAGSIDNAYGVVAVEDGDH